MRREPRGRDGGLLVVALVAVTVVTLLALAIGALVRAHAARFEANRERRELRRAAANAVALAAADRLALDTNGWDAAAEPWSRDPWERREEGWVLRVSGLGWSDEPGMTVGLVDEERRVPLNTADAAWLAALLGGAAGLDAGSAARLAACIVDWRDDDDQALAGGAEAAVYGRREAPWQAPDAPFAAVAELAQVPGVDAEAMARLRPLLTVSGSGRINVNTAPEAVLRATLTAVEDGDRAASTGLLDRLLAFRLAGHAFTAAGATAIGRELGGLPADQAALLGRAEGRLDVASTCFSGVAEAIPAEWWKAGRRAGGRVHFTWSRASGVVVRWTEE